MGQATAHCDRVNALTEHDQCQIRLDIGSSLHGVTVITDTGRNTKEFRSSLQPGLSALQHLAESRGLERETREICERRGTMKTDQVL